MYLFIQLVSLTSCSCAWAVHSFTFSTYFFIFLIYSSYLPLTCISSYFSHTSSYFLRFISLYRGRDLGIFPSPRVYLYIGAELGIFSKSLGIYIERKLYGVLPSPGAYMGKNSGFFQVPGHLYFILCIRKLGIFLISKSQGLR